MIRPDGRFRANRLVAISLSLVLLAGAGAHLRLLWTEATIRNAIAAHLAYGDRRESTLRKAMLPVEVFDCTNDPANALARLQLAWPVGGGEPAVQLHQPMEWGKSPLVDLASTAPYALVAAFAKERRASPWTPSSSSAPVRLSLCRESMQKAYAWLQGTGRRSTAIVLDAATGHVRVLAAYDPHPDSLHRMLAITETRQPGSVAKLLLAAAAWTAGSVDRPLACPEHADFGGRTLRNAHGGHYRTGDISTMLARSCNTSAAELMMRLVSQVGADEVGRIYAMWGVPQRRLAIAGGVVPRSDLWDTHSLALRRWLTPVAHSITLDRKTTRWDQAQIAIGQGPLSMNPLRLTQFVATIANDGLQPYLRLETDAPYRDARRIMSAAVARRLQSAMRDVVTMGTAVSVKSGATAQLGGVLAGKTGSPQRVVGSDAGILNGATGRRMIEDGVFSAFFSEGGSRSQMALTIWIDGGGPGNGLATAIADSLAASILASRSVSPTNADRAALVKRRVQ